MLSINWSPDIRACRQFGMAGFVALAILGGLAAGRWDAPLLAAACGGGALTLIALSVTSPATLRHVYRAALVITFPLGLIVSRICLACLYYGMVMPIGLFFKAVNRDALQRSLDATAPTYWKSCQRGASAQRYFRRW